MTMKKALPYAILAVAAIVLYRWWSSRAVTAPAASAPNSVGTGPAAAPTMSLGQIGIVDQFIGGLPGLGFGLQVQS